MELMRQTGSSTGPRRVRTRALPGATKRADTLRKTIVSLAVTGVLVTSLAGCATSPNELSTADLWRDYCATDGFQTDGNTRVTVQSWDPEATTAGHRGVATDPVLEPDGSNPPPRGC